MYTLIELVIYNVYFGLFFERLVWNLVKWKRGFSTPNVDIVRAVFINKDIIKFKLSLKDTQTEMTQDVFLFSPPWLQSWEPLGLKQTAVTSLFIFSVPVHSLVRACRMWMSPNLPQTAMNFPSGDTSNFCNSRYCLSGKVYFESYTQGESWSEISTML